MAARRTRLPRRNTSRSRSTQCDLHKVGLGQGYLAVVQIQPVHRNLQLLVVHLYEKVVVVYLLTLERIVRGAFDRIRMSSASSRNEVNYAAMLVTLVVMYVTGKDNEAGECVGLPLFEQLGQFLLAGSGRVPASVFFFVRGTRIGRMVKHDEDEVDIRRNLIDLLRQ